MQSWLLMWVSVNKGENQSKTSQIDSQKNEHKSTFTPEHMLWLEDEKKFKEASLPMQIMSCFKSTFKNFQVSTEDIYVSLNKT